MLPIENGQYESALAPVCAPGSVSPRQVCVITGLVRRAGLIAQLGADETIERLDAQREEFRSLCAPDRKFTYHFSYLIGSVG